MLRRLTFYITVTEFLCLLYIWYCESGSLDKRQEKWYGICVYYSLLPPTYTITASFAKQISKFILKYNWKTGIWYCDLILKISWYRLHLLIGITLTAAMYNFQLLIIPENSTLSSSYSTISTIFNYGVNFLINPCTGSVFFSFLSVGC